MAETTFDIVRRVLVDGLGVEESAVTEESSLSEDLGADSLDSVEIIMSLEEEFDVKIDSSQAEEFTTVGQIVSFISSAKL